MEITDIRCRQLVGTLQTDPGDYYVERLVTPLDVYEEFRTGHIDAGGLFPAIHEGELVVKQNFLFVDTDTNITGLIGPLDEKTAKYVLSLSDFLLGRDPVATAWLWDLLHRNTIHGHKGRMIHAISAIDIALWDIKGKYYDEPVYRLLGGPTRDRLPAYASLLWFSTDTRDVRQTARDIKEQGYVGQKWFFAHGPGSGREGKNENLELVETARETAGENHDLMFDAWRGWNRNYALEMVKKMADFEPAWLEEPVGAAALDALVDVKAASPFPIAGGEHAYTRWSFYDLLRRNALDILQPDPLWAGGITEVEKICTLASVRELPVMIHGISVPTCVHIAAAQPPSVCPYVEYLVRPNEALQHFFADPVIPTGGGINLPTKPGLGIEIESSTIEAETEVTC